MKKLFYTARVIVSNIGQFKAVDVNSILDSDMKYQNILVNTQLENDIKREKTWLSCMKKGEYKIDVSYEIKNIEKNRYELYFEIINTKPLTRKSKNDAYKEMILDLLIQATGFIKDNKTFIDSQCLSPYEEACSVLEEDGFIEKINDRIYEVIDD